MQWMKRTIFDSIMLSYFFCVAVIAIFRPTEQALLNLGQNTVIFTAGLVLGAFVSFAVNSKGLKSLGEMIFEPPHLKAKEQRGSVWRLVWPWQLLIFVALTFSVGIKVTQFSLTEIFDEFGFAGAVRLFQGLASPNWEILPVAILKIIETIFMAFMATSLAIPFAFVLSFAAAKNVMQGPGAFAVYLILRTVLNVTRSIEALIWAIIFSVWVGIGPFAGMLALMIHSIASLAKQYSEIVEAVNDGPIEGIQSTGANKLQILWFAVVPQVLLPYISFTIYRWDINIRMATIIGLVGGGGIGTLLIKYQGQAMWSEVGTIILVIAFVVWFMDTASAYLREALK
jgi:phosphonate transport system permease protein